MLPSASSFSKACNTVTGRSRLLVCTAYNNITTVVQRADAPGRGMPTVDSDSDAPTEPCPEDVSLLPAMPVEAGGVALEEVPFSL